MRHDEHDYDVDGLLGFITLVTIVLVTAKLFGWLTWPWAIVLAPVWVPWVGLGVVALIGWVIIKARGIRG